jgi:hypothetical protein
VGREVAAVIDSKLASIADVIAQAATEINAVQTTDERLEAVVKAATGAVPGFEAASITLRATGGRPETRAASSVLVEELDQHQYEAAEGPCFEALTRQGPVTVPSVRHEQRWPTYIRRALQAGVTAQLAVHIGSHGVDGGHGRVRGALNLYATTGEGIDPEAPGIALLLATNAALALGWTQAEEQLNQALATRKVIGQAIGIVMERYRVTEETAFAFLARVSSSRNVKLREVAAELVAESDSRYAGDDAR